jgi:hypothetical protein
MPISFLGIRYPDDNGSFATGTMMLGTQSKIDCDKSKGNTFVGLGAGNENIAGETGSNGCVGNTFIGAGAGHNTYSDISKPEWYSCYNTFVGRSAGVNNQTGFNNTYLGSYSGKNNTEGINNTFIGADAGFNNSGSSNIFIGASAGYNTNDNNNIIIGTETIENTPGNIVVGNDSKCIENAQRNIILGNYNIINNEVVNSVVIGFNNNVVDSNTIYLGNEQTTDIKASSNISIVADTREMLDLTEDVYGLEFLDKIHLIAYRNSNGWNQGIIGQELHSIIDDYYFKNFNGLIEPKDSSEKYRINYTAFIPNLIKSIQQLSNEITELREEIRQLKAEPDSQETEEVVIKPRRNKRK